ncbi:S8 family serine peptidase [Actinoplanes sp. SE50/110]|uniref:S8 family serine peptidase n=1 Tax=unclassified Actinoplanes TaxID=2626549 RepID=UPI00351009E0
MPPFHADHVRESEWHLSFLKIQEVHAITTGAGIVIALPDTGIQPHPDISKNLMPGIDLTSSDGNSGQYDRDGHGTEMAGLIVGRGHGPAGGILGIAPSAKILPVKSYEVGAENAQLAQGIAASVNLGVSVISVPAGVSPSQKLKDSIDQALKANTVVVAASGNSQSAAGFGYPAALPGVLAVGAIDRTGHHAPFSITGPNMSLCAPGDEIVTTGLNSTYRIARGTSASTAIVSGAAALVRARFPQLSAQEVIHRLTATATDIGPPGWDEECGFGVLNIVKALTADVPPVSAGASLPAVGGTGQVAGSGDGPGSGRTVAVLGGVAAVLAGGVFAGLLVAWRRRRTRH